MQGKTWTRLEKPSPLPRLPSRSIQNLRASMPGYAVNVGEEATKTRVDHQRGARFATQRLSRIGRHRRVLSTGLFLHAWSLARQSVCLCCDRRRSIRVSVAIPDRFCRMPAMHRIERSCGGSLLLFGQGFRLDPDVFFARRLLLPVLFHPGGKALAGGGVFTGEAKGGDFAVRNPDFV